MAFVKFCIYAFVGLVFLGLAMFALNVVTLLAQTLTFY